MTRRFVFVPLAGEHTGAEWRRFPHALAWGFVDDEFDANLTALHVVGAAADCIPLNELCHIFDAEMELAVNIDPDDPNLPDAVCVALAKLALLPVSSANQEENS